MMKILLTGANGQLGRAIQKEYGSSAEFIRTDMIEGEGLRPLDISDLDAVRQVVAETKPDVLINCAAYTNVDGCETNEELAYTANAVGPKNLAIVTAENDITLVHISTDYVFNGEGTRPYVESDLPDPVSAYGRTKHSGEMFVQEFGKKWFILRTAWLYGDGKNFVKTMLKLAETHDELSVVCDQVGTPTSAAELSKMIRFLLDVADGDIYGIYHATCEGDTNWADFAETIFEKCGLSVKVNHVTSEEYAAMNPAAANRPHYSILENQALKDLNAKLKAKDGENAAHFMMANWEDALSDYMRELA